MKYIFILFLMVTSYSISAHEWHELTPVTSKDLTCVSAVNDSVAWFCGKDGTLLFTTDGGNSLKNRTGNNTIGNFDLVSIFALNADTVFCTASPETDNINHITTTSVFRTTDRGQSWTKVFSQTGGFVNGIFMFDDSNGVLYGNPVNGRWSVWRTSDGGITWDSAGVKIPAPAISESGRPNAFFADAVSKTFIFGANNGSFYTSHDLGKSWSVITIPVVNDIYCITFSDSANGMVGGNGLIKTQNGGTSWKNITELALGHGPITAILVHDFWHYFLIRQSTAEFPEYRIYHTGSFGDNSWDTSYIAPDKKPYLFLSEARKGGYVYGLRQGGGITVGIHSDEPVTNISDFNSNPLTYYLKSNYPNPFNPSTIIAYSIAKEGFVSLKVFNSIGQEVAILVNERQAAGMHQIAFRAGSLPSGIYFYSLESEGFKQVKKMILMK
ncbi:MAG: T9SS type A sorting domain-containing protein [Methanococcaceae archaeon]